MPDSAHLTQKEFPLKKLNLTAKLLLNIFCLLLLCLTGCSQQTADDGSSDKTFSTETGPRSPDELQTEFSDWEEAYRYVLCHTRSFMSDPYQLYGQWENEIFDLTDMVLRVILYDFDGNGIPELVLGAETSIIYSYENNKIFKCAEISLPQNMYRLDEFYFDGEAFLAVAKVDTYPDTVVFAACSFSDGQYITALCDDDHPSNNVVNQQPADRSQCYRCFPIIHKYQDAEGLPEYSSPKYWFNPNTQTVRTEETVRKYGGGPEFRELGAVPIDENFDLNIFAW